MNIPPRACELCMVMYHPTSGRQRYCPEHSQVKQRKSPYAKGSRMKPAIKAHTDTAPNTIKAAPITHGSAWRYR